MSELCSLLRPIRQKPMSMCQGRVTREGLLVKRFE